MKRLLLVTAALCLISASAFADETLKFRAVYHVTAAQAQEVGDTDGHTMSVARATGLVSFPDGSVGASQFVSTTDYVKGSGSFHSYNSITLTDGSVLWFATTSGSAAVNGSTTELKSPVAVLGGKGRFEGAKGDGSVTGARFSTEVTSGNEIYTDWVLNIKK
jgi:hypothetical protein